MNILYELFMVILSFLSIYFAWQDYTNSLRAWQHFGDCAIWIIFIIDYTVRLIKSDQKKTFFKSNILDFISILPFNSALRIFRTFKFLRLLKLVKMAKVLALSGRIYKKLGKFLKTNGFHYMILISFFMILISGILVSYFENMTLPNGIWWSFVTITTVGYGDIAPNSLGGRIIACILMILGIGLIGSLTSTITTFFLDSPHNNITSNGTHTLNDTFNLNEFVKSKGASELELDILKAYFELDPEIRRTVIEHFSSHLSKRKDTVETNGLKRIK